MFNQKLFKVSPRLGPNRLILVRSESKITKDFDSRVESKSFYFIFDSRGRIIFWFTFINNSFGFLFILIQKSREGESWFTYCRILGCFDFESKVNKSESRITLVRALGLRTFFSILIFTTESFFFWLSTLDIFFILSNIRCWSKYHSKWLYDDKLFSF